MLEMKEYQNKWVAESLNLMVRCRYRWNGKDTV